MDSFENHNFSSGHKFVPMPENEANFLISQFPNFKGGDVGTLQPGNWLAWAESLKLSDQWYNFKVMEDDVMIMSFPKSGTMWLSEVIWCLRNFSKIETEVAKMTLLLRVPCFSMDACWKNDQDSLYASAKRIFPSLKNNGTVLLQAAEMSPRPRTLRTHHSFSLCPKDLLDKTKVVFIARNPKDVVISMFHFFNLVKSFEFNGTFDECLDIFLSGKVPFGPFWEMNQEAWERRNHPNMHFVFFENLKKDTKKEILRLNKFLGTNLTDSQIDQIKEFTSFEAIKKRDPVFAAFQRNPNENSITNKQSSGFFRRGESGGWKDTLTEEQNEKLDKWIEENSKKYDVPFIYE